MIVKYNRMTNKEITDFEIFFSMIKNKSKQKFEVALISFLRNKDIAFDIQGNIIILYGTYNEGH